MRGLPAEGVAAYGRAAILPFGRNTPRRRRYVLAARRWGGCAHTLRPFGYWRLPIRQTKGPCGGSPHPPWGEAVGSSLSYAGAALTRATIDAQGDASPATIIQKYDRFGSHAVSARVPI